MGVGTSLGAYFEDDFKLQSGVQEEVIKPKDPGDNNVVTPQKVETDKEVDKSEQNPTTGTGIPIRDLVPDYGEELYKSLPHDLRPSITETPEETKGFFQRLSIVNALRGMMNPANVEEDVKLLKGVWQSLKLPGDVMKGEVDPSSPEGIHKAFGLAMTMATGRMPKAKMATEAPKPLEGEVIPPLETMLSPQQQARETLNQLRRHFAEREPARDATAADMRRLSPDIERFEQIPYEGPSGFYSPVDEALSMSKPQFKGEMAERIAEAKKSKDITFFETPSERSYGKHYFANEKGVGEIKVHYRPGSKTLRVSEIGIIEDVHGNKISPLSYESYKEGPQTFGTKDTKKILQYLKEQYPDAEWISGYRVSGARNKTGEGFAEARMWIGKGPKPKTKEVVRKDAAWYRQQAEEMSSAANRVPAADVDRALAEIERALSEQEGPRGWTVIEPD